MRYDFAGGCRTDEGPVTANPFVLYSENIRWRDGRPETVDLFTTLLDENGLSIVLPVSDPDVTLWNDRELAICAIGKSLWIYRYATREILEVVATSAASSGRWWFAYTEEEIFCARSSVTGRVQVINRDTLAIQALPNSPVGAICGGIVNDVLVLGGTTSFLTGPEAPAPELVVRWSARRTDPSSSGSPAGPFGFEDWTPSDVNASGENFLDTGRTIVGGGESRNGFIVFTDAAAYIERPLANLLTFEQRRVSKNGLYASGTWIESGSNVYWLDESRMFNVYDGGPPRKLKNPMQMASTELMEERLESAVLVDNSRYSEIILCYTTQGGSRLQLVYNTLDGLWYPFRLGWLTFTDRKGSSPPISIDTAGNLYGHSLREAVTAEYVQPSSDLIPLKRDLVRIGPVAVVPFTFFLMTGYMTVENPLRGGPRNLNVVLSHTYGTDPDATTVPTDDDLYIQIETRDKAGRDAPVVTADTQSFKVGQHGADFRGGGKTMQIVVAGVDVTTFIRFGDIFIDVVDGARR